MRQHDSRRYHRRHGPRHRPFNFSGSSGAGETVSPFGGLPYRLAGQARKNFSQPLSEGFSFDPSGKFMDKLAGATGPTANFIRQGSANMANYLPTLQNLSSQLTAGANSAYGGYQAAIDSFLKQLPGFENTMATATGGGQSALDYAQRSAADAFSPLPGRASFQEASRRALAPAREGAAARGMLEGGQAQAGEQNILSDLAFNTLQQDQANQQAATAGLGTAATNLGNLATGGAQLASVGPEARGALFSAYPQLAQLLTGSAQLPMEGQNQLLQFLTAAQDPTYSLLRMVLPQVAQRTQSHSFGLLSG
jgi:hypothetical protein